MVFYFHREALLSLLKGIPFGTAQDLACPQVPGENRNAIVSRVLLNHKTVLRGSGKLRPLAPQSSRSHAFFGNP